MYTLLMPFKLQQGRSITELGDPFLWNQLSIHLKYDEPYYIFCINNFQTYNDARNFIKNIEVILTYFLLRHSIAADFTSEIQKIAYSADPLQAAKNLNKSFDTDFEGEVNGLIGAGEPAIYKSDLNIKKITIGSVSVTQSNKAESLYPTLLMALESTMPENSLSDNKLSIAIALYKAFFSEESLQAKFLTLIMAFETLSEPTQRPPIVLDFIDNVRKQISNIKPTMTEEESNSLDNLARELSYRKHDSIRSSIRKLVLSNLKTDSEKLARKAVALYDKRSTLVHSGALPQAELGTAITDAKNILELILSEKYTTLVGIDENI